MGAKLVPAIAVRLGLRAPLTCVAGSWSKWGRGASRSRGRGSLPPATGAGTVCVLKNQLLGGTRASEASQGLSAGAWGRTAGHSPAAWCQLLWREQGGEGVCLGFLGGAGGLQSTNKLQALLPSE